MTLSLYAGLLMPYVLYAITLNEYAVDGGRLWYDSVNSSSIPLLVRIMVSHLVSSELRNNINLNLSMLLNNKLLCKLLVQNYVCDKRALKENSRACHASLAALNIKKTIKFTDLINSIFGNH